MRYRGEIDGLRAVAVVPVILHHAGFSALSGGFLGVDIFFVISGYLITTIILGELEAGTFNLKEFYARRARRILPAVCFVMLVCILFAIAWLMPYDLHKFSKSVVAVSVFSSNFLFWGEAGYFDTAAKLKPLLHTWSLAIEEQFYILFPLFLMLTFGLQKARVLAILLVIFTLSLTVAHWSSLHSDAKVASSGFYLLPARAWELILGVFVAFWLQSRPASNCSYVHHVGSISGLALIIYAMVFYGSETPLPSLYSLVPTIGSALVILFAVQGTLVNCILKNSVLVGIGLVSYSAYLWHQPLLAFARYRTISEPDSFVMAGVCLVTFALAYLSWRWIEGPFRVSRNVPSVRVFWISLGVLLVFVVVGIVGQEKSIRKWRLPAHLAADTRYGGEGVGWISLSKNNSEEFVLYGDSHAKQYFNALRGKFGPGSLIAEPACMALPYIVNEYKNHSTTRSNCTEKYNQLISHVVSQRPKRLFIAYSWNKKLVSLGSKKPIGVGGSPEGLKAIARGLSKLVADIPASVDVYVVGNVPGASVANAWMARGYVRCHFYAGSNCVDSYPIALGSAQHLNTFLEGFVSQLKTPRIGFVDPYQSLCTERTCFIRIDGRLVYSDHAHLTRYGSRLVVNGMR